MSDNSANSWLGRINKSKIAKGAILVVATAAVVSFIGYKVYSLGNKLMESKDAMIFAFNNHELVDPVREQYELEASHLKDSFVKRQLMDTTDSGKKE